MFVNDYLWPTSFCLSGSDDALDYVRLGGGVAVHVWPFLRGKRPFCLLVTAPVVTVLAQAIAEDQVSGDLRAAGGVDVNVRVLFRRAKHPVLVPFRFAHAQNVAGGFQLRQVGRLICGVRDDDQDVDDGLGGEAGNGRGSDVLDLQRCVAERTRDHTGVRCKFSRPVWIVVENSDLNFFRAAD